MRFAAILMTLVGLLAAVPAAVAHADALCSDFMKMDDADKLAVIQDVAAHGGPAVTQIAPVDSVSLATAICRGHPPETVGEVMARAAAGRTN